MSIIAQVTAAGYTRPATTYKDYNWLIASVKSWTRRSDLAPQIPDLVMLAEERISADLQARGMETLSLINTAAGASNAPMPAAVIEIMSILVPNHGDLDYIPIDRFNERYNDGCLGVPREYTIVGDELYFGPTPDAVYPLQLSATMTLIPLADSADGTNWLIKRNPSLYLAATMFEAMVNLRDDAGQGVWNAKYQIALAAANSTQNTPSELVVRPDARTP